MDDRATVTRWMFGKSLGIAGAILVWLPIALMLVTAAAGSVQAGRLQLDYLLPAEYSLAVLIGGALLVAAAVLVNRRRALICWSFGLAVAALALMFAVTVVTGIASGETVAEGLPLVLATGLLVIYGVMVVVLGVASVLLLRDLSVKNARREG